MKATTKRGRMLCLLLALVMMAGTAVLTVSEDDVLIRITRIEAWMTKAAIPKYRCYCSHCKRLPRCA